MSSSLILSLVRALLLFIFGGAAVLAWTHALYASTALAALLALWIAILNAVQAVRKRAAPLPASVPLESNDASKQQRRLTAYLNLSPAPLVTLDSSNQLHAVNRAARRLFGAENLIAQPPGRLAQSIAATAPGQSASLRMTLQGSERPYALSTADLNIGPETMRIAALVDIEAELRAAETTTLRDLVQILSHEIMNALTPIASLGRTAAQMIDAPDADPDEIRDALETVARRAEGLQRFSEAYRDLARLPPPTIKSIEMTAFCDDIARLFATRFPAARLNVNQTAGPQRLSADPDQLSAALWVLLQNAVEARVDGDATIMLETAATVEGTRFRITDDGPGVTASNTPMIFQPFFTTKTSGSGVGLTLARQIARAHGGDLILVNDHDQTGARFDLIF